MLDTIPNATVFYAVGEHWPLVSDQPLVKDTLDFSVEEAAERMALYRALFKRGETLSLPTGDAISVWYNKNPGKTYIYYSAMEIEALNLGRTIYDCETFAFFDPFAQTRLKELEGVTPLESLAANSVDQQSEQALLSARETRMREAIDRFHNGDYEGAAASFGRMIEMQQENLDLRTWLAKALTMAGKQPSLF